MGIYINIKNLDESIYSRSIAYEATCSECGTKVKGRKSNLLKAKICRHVKKKTSAYCPIIQYRKISDRSIMLVFHAMVKRCYCEYSDSYKWYGGKGITICDEWIEDPARFEAWVKENLISFTGSDAWVHGVSIDRISSSEPYSSKNCRIISLSENCRMNGRAKPFVVNGVTKTGRQWAETIGRSPAYINVYRQKYGEANTIAYIQSVLSSNRKSA